MIADLAYRLAGEDAVVHGIMKVGEDPHIYEVRPADAVTISKADLVLSNGLHLEARLAGVIEQSLRGRSVRLAEAAGIEPLGSQVYQGAPDPHVWMDVALWSRCVQAARDALVDADPANADGYRQRADVYLRELEELDQWVRQQWEAVPADRRQIVTSHDAFNYYARAYGVKVHGVIGISTDAQPKASDIEALREQIASQNIRAMFVETSVTPTLNQIVRNLAADTGVQLGGTLFSDSLGPTDGPAGTYRDMIRHNTQAMIDALR